MPPLPKRQRQAFGGIFPKTSPFSNLFKSLTPQKTQQARNAVSTAPVTQGALQGPVRPPQPSAPQPAPIAQPTAVAPQLAALGRQQAPTPTVQAPRPAPTAPVAPVAQPQPTFQPQAPDEQLTALRERVLGVFKPSAREKELQKQLSDILTGEEQGQEAIRTQAIPTPLLRGQAGALERQVGLQATPLQRQLGLLQRQREQEQVGAETALGFRQEDVTREQQQREAFQQQQQALEVPKLDTQVVEVGGRKVLINTQTGQQIADLGGAKTGAGGAVDPNFLSALITNPSLFNSLTPSVKSSLLPSLVQAGFKPVRELAPKVSEGFAAIDDVRGIIDRLKGLLDAGVSTGRGAAISGGIQRFGGFENEDQLRFNQLAEDLFRTVLKATSGVAASEREVGRLTKFLPKFGKQEQVNLSNIIEFVDTLNQTEFNALNRQAASGFDVSGQINVLDRRLVSEIAGQDIESLRNQVGENEVLVLNRKTRDIEAITEDEFDNILHLTI